MKNLREKFFAEGEVLFMGYSSRAPQFSNSIYNAFTNAGIRVYPLNPKTSEKYNGTVDLSGMQKSLGKER